MCVSGTSSVLLLLAAVAGSADEPEAIMIEPIVVGDRRLTFCARAPHNLSAAAREFCDFHQIADARCADHVARITAQPEWTERLARQSAELELCGKVRGHPGARIER